MNSNRNQSVLLKWESYILIFSRGLGGFGEEKGEVPGWGGTGWKVHGCHGHLLERSRSLGGRLSQNLRKRGRFQVFREEQSCSRSLADLLNILRSCPHPHKNKGFYILHKKAFISNISNIRISRKK